MKRTAFDAWGGADGGDAGLVGDGELAPLRIFEGGFQPRKMCQHFFKGTCNKGDQCTFAHAPEELHPSAAAELGGHDAATIVELQREQQQQQAATGGEDGNHCFSCLQGPREFPGRRPYLLCQFWLRHPMSCVKGDTCTYAHGLSESGLEGPELKQLCLTISQVAQQSTAELAGGGQLQGGKGQQSWGAGGGTLAISAGGQGFKGAGGFQKGGKAMAPASTGSYFGGAKAGKGGGPVVGGGAGGRFLGTGFAPNKMCELWVQTGTCNFDQRCTFAHGPHELSGKGTKGGGKEKAAAPMQPWEAAAWQMQMEQPQKSWSGKKSKMCTFFENGACQKGEACTFAHSPDELEI